MNEVLVDLFFLNKDFDSQTCSVWAINYENGGRLLRQLRRFHQQQLEQELKEKSENHVSSLTSLLVEPQKLIIKRFVTITELKFPKTPPNLRIGTTKAPSKKTNEFSFNLSQNSSGFHFLQMKTRDSLVNKNGW